MALHGRIEDCLSRLAAGPSGRTKLVVCEDSGSSSGGGSLEGGGSSLSSAGAALLAERLLSQPAAPRRQQQAEPPLPWLLLDLFKLVEPRESASLVAHRRQVCKEAQNATQDMRTGLRIAARLFEQISKELASCRQLAGQLCVSSSMRQLLLDSRPNGIDSIRAAVWQQFVERASTLEMPQRALATAAAKRASAAACGGSNGGAGISAISAVVKDQELEELEERLSAAAQQAMQALHACTRLAAGAECKHALAQHGQRVAATLQAAMRLAGRCTVEGEPRLRLPPPLRKQVPGVGEFWLEQALEGLEPQAGSGWHLRGGKPANAGFAWQRGFLSLSGLCLSQTLPRVLRQPDLPLPPVLLMSLEVVYCCGWTPPGPVRQEAGQLVWTHCGQLAQLLAQRLPPLAEHWHSGTALPTAGQQQDAAAGATLALASLAAGWFELDGAAARAAMQCVGFTGLQQLFGSIFQAGQWAGSGPVLPWGMQQPAGQLIDACRGLEPFVLEALAVMAEAAEAPEAAEAAQAAAAAPTAAAVAAAAIAPCYDAHGTDFDDDGEQMEWHWEAAPAAGAQSCAALQAATPGRMAVEHYANVFAPSQGAWTCGEVQAAAVGVAIAMQEQGSAGAAAHAATYWQRQQGSEQSLLPWEVESAAAVRSTLAVYDPIQALEQWAVPKPASQSAGGVRAVHRTRLSGNSGDLEQGMLREDGSQHGQPMHCDSRGHATGRRPCGRTAEIIRFLAKMTGAIMLFGTCLGKGSEQ